MAAADGTYSMTALASEALRCPALPYARSRSVPYAGNHRAIRRGGTRGGGCNSLQLLQERCRSRYLAEKT